MYYFKTKLKHLFFRILQPNHDCSTKVQYVEHTDITVTKITSASIKQNGNALNCSWFPLWEQICWRQFCLRFLVCRFHDLSAHPVSSGMCTPPFHLLMTHWHQYKHPVWKIIRPWRTRYTRNKWKDIAWLPFAIYSCLEVCI